MTESTKVTKKRKWESTIIHGRPQKFFEGGVAVDCIALNYWGKHKRKMAIRGINQQERNQQQ